MGTKDPVLEILGICVLTAASDHRGTKRWVVSVVTTPPTATSSPLFSYTDFPGT